MISRSTWLLLVAALTASGAGPLSQESAAEQANAARLERQHQADAALDGVPAIGSRAIACRGIDNQTFVDTPDNTMNNGGYVITNLWDIRPDLQIWDGKYKWACIGYADITQRNGRSLIKKFVAADGRLTFPTDLSR